MLFFEVRSDMNFHVSGEKFGILFLTLGTFYWRVKIFALQNCFYQELFVFINKLIDAQSTQE